MSRISRDSGNERNELPLIELRLELHEPLLVAYFEPVAEPDRSAKAVEALTRTVLTPIQSERDPRQYP